MSESSPAPPATVDGAASLSASSASVSAEESVYNTPIGRIRPQFVPDSWTVTFDAAVPAVAAAVPADDAAAKAASSPAAEEEKEQSPAAAAAAAAAAVRIEIPLVQPASLTVTRINSTPLMLRVENFLSPAECAEVLRLAYTSAAPVWKPYRNITYKPIHGPDGEVIKQKFEVGYSEAATLFQLDYGHFEQIRPLIDLFADRVARVVGTTNVYCSNMRRLLRYKPGQKFELHADDYDRLEPLHRGRRLLTCLIYVHTEPGESGGGTVFPLLDSGSYRSPPLSGSMLVFRNFDPDNDFKFDARCQHYAETTCKGSKYAINLYIVEKEGIWWH